MSKVEQVGGTHYQTSTGIGHWDLCEKYDIPYLEGYASKYPLRWRSKGGVEDLKKSLSCVDKILSCWGERGDRPVRRVPKPELNRLFDDMRTGKAERILIALILHEATWEAFQVARNTLAELIERNP